MAWIGRESARSRLDAYPHDSVPNRQVFLVLGSAVMWVLVIIVVSLW